MTRNDETSEQKVRDAGNSWRHPSWWHTLVVLPWVIGVLFILYQSRVYRVVATRQQTESGTITVREPDNHSRYGYTFIVEGRSYSGWQIPQGSEEWTLGQQVVVYYDAADPTTNALRDFTIENDGIRAPLPLLVVGIVTVVSLLIFLRRTAGSRQSPG